MNRRENFAVSHRWLNIQSFFTDTELLQAVNDVSIFLKLEAAGARDGERAELAERGWHTLRDFFQRLRYLGAVERN